MRSALTLLASFSIAGCATEQPRPAGSEATVRGEPLNCIDVTRVAGRRAEGKRALVFEMSDGTIYRNDLPEACPGIERASAFGTLAIDPVESRLCRNDLVRVYDPADLTTGGIKSAPRCRLGSFTPTAAARDRR